MNEDALTFVEVFEQIREIFSDAEIDHEKAVAKNNFAAARRARTKLQSVKRLLGEYRKLSNLHFSTLK